MSANLQLIYYTEFFRTVFGFSLLIPELYRLRSSIKQRPTLSMIGILIFYNLIFMSRAFGIQTNNSDFRQYVPALSALLSAIFLVTWGALVIDIEKMKYNLAIIIIIVGIVGFILGASVENIYVSIVGIILFGMTMILIITKMFIFVFKESPYLQARYRIFLMSFATVFMIIFESLGVVAMRRLNYEIATVFFLIEIVGRFTMTLSIFLPSKLKEFLSYFIK